MSSLVNKTVKQLVKTQVIFYFKRVMSLKLWIIKKNEISTLTSLQIDHFPLWDLYQNDLTKSPIRMIILDLKLKILNAFFSYIYFSFTKFTFVIRSSVKIKFAFLFKIQFPKYITSWGLTIFYQIEYQKDHLEHYYIFLVTRPVM